MTSKVDERMWTEGQRMQEFFRLKAKEGDSGICNRLRAYAGGAQPSQTKQCSWPLPCQTA